MGTKRALIALISIIAALTPSLGRAGALADRVVTLRGVSRFTTTDTRSTLVRFPGPTPVADLDIGYHGDGRVYGYILQKTGHYREEFYRPVLENVTIGQCSAAACRARQGFNFGVGFNVGAKLAGVWRLFVIADGAPVTMMVGIDGVHGSIAASPSDRVATEIRTLNPQISADSGHRVFSTGGFTHTKGTDFGMVGLWVVGDTHLGTAFGSCLYEKRPAFPSEVAFVPGCPVGDDYTTATPGRGARGGVVFTAASLGRQEGLGGWYATSADVDRYGAVAIWLDRNS